VNLFGFVDTTDTLGINSNINWTHRSSQQVFFFTSYNFSRLRTLVKPNFENQGECIAGDAGIAGNDQDPANWGPPALGFSSGIAVPFRCKQLLQPQSHRRGSPRSMGIYRGKHNITVGGIDFREQQYNDFFQQNPRGAFTFTGAGHSGRWQYPSTAGSDLADFLHRRTRYQFHRIRQRRQILHQHVTMPTQPTTGAFCRISPSMPARAGSMARRSPSSMAASSILI
jgi:hypothetical protein